jgi:hypothetical protein
MEFPLTQSLEDETIIDSSVPEKKHHGWGILQSVNGNLKTYQITQNEISIGFKNL